MTDNPEGKPAVGYDLNDAQDREDRRKHLDHVSAVIARMASSSTLFKGWSVTIAGAAFGVAIVRDSWYLMVLGLLGVAFFALLDCFYLENEKRYRDLYTAIAETNTVPPFSMKARQVASDSRNRSYTSWSIRYFYFPILAAGLVLLMAALVTDGEEEEERHQPWPHQPGQHHPADPHPAR